MVHLIYGLRQTALFIDQLLHRSKQAFAVFSQRDAGGTPYKQRDAGLFFQYGYGVAFINAHADS